MERKLNLYYLKRMIKRISTIVILCLFIMSCSLAVALGQNHPESEIGVFNQDECVFDVPEWVTRKVDCGFVTVPAFYERPEKGNFRLYVTVFRSSDDKVKSDPLIYLHGGPGALLTPNLALSLYSAMNMMAPKRDIIMFDQRGTSIAEPQFHCRNYNDYTNSYNGAINETYVERTRELLENCLVRIRDEVGIDFRAFNSIENVRDVETIRQALDVKQWNVLGSSYGSTLALMTLRKYPESVRSVILGSNFPLPEIMPLEQQNSFYAALTRSFEVCESNSLCSEAYPNLKRVFENTFLSLEADPVVLEGKTSNSSITVDGGRFAIAVSDIYSGGTYISSTPKFIYAAANRDKSFLREVFGITAPNAAQEQRQPSQSNQNEPNEQTESTPESTKPEETSSKSTPSEDPGYNRSIVTPVFTGYMCNEEVTFVAKDIFTEKIYAYQPIAEFYKSKPPNSPAIYNYCNLLNIDEPFAPELNEAVESSVPALIMNGGLDPTSGPEYALQVENNLTNAQLVLFPAGTHGVSLSNECAIGIGNAFLNNPMQKVNSSCAQEDFKIGFATDKIASLKPFKLNSLNLTGVYPANWAETTPGTFVRYIVGDVSLTQIMFKNSQQKTLELLATRGEKEPQQSQTPTQIDNLKANGLNWTLYKLERDSGVLNYIATASLAPKETLVVFLTLTEQADLKDYYYEEAFLPAVKAFKKVDADTNN